MTKERLDFIRLCVKTQTTMQESVIAELLQYIDELESPFVVAVRKTRGKWQVNNREVE